MSETFDEVVAASWERFEDRLTRAVRDLESGSLAIEPAEPDEENVPYVMLDVEDQWLTAEVVGLSREHDLAAVEALGWSRSTEEDASPFWGATVHADEAELLVGMISSVLRQVFGVTDPAFLADGPLGAPGTPEASAPHDEEVDDACDHETVIGYPDDAAELVEMVEQALAVSYGPDVLRDGDGDFPINTGVVPLWVRALDEAPAVRLFSYVVRSVRDVRQARIEVGILNRRTSLLKFHLDDRVITASYELPAAPFVGPQLLHVLDRAAELLNELAADTAARVGGKLWFDGIADTSTDVQESA